MNINKIDLLQLVIDFKVNNISNFKFNMRERERERERAHIELSLFPKWVSYDGRIVYYPFKNNFFMLCATAGKGKKSILIKKTKNPNWS